MGELSVALTDSSPAALSEMADELLAFAKTLSKQSKLREVRHYGIIAFKCFTTALLLEVEELSLRNRDFALEVLDDWKMSFNDTIALNLGHIKREVEE